MTLKAPFTTINGVPNQLPQSLISPVALKIASFFPAPLNGCGQYLTLLPALSVLLAGSVPPRLSTERQANDFSSAIWPPNRIRLIPHDLTPENFLNLGNNGSHDFAQSAHPGPHLADQRHRSKFFPGFHKPHRPVSRRGSMVRPLRRRHQRVHLCSQCHGAVDHGRTQPRQRRWHQS